MSLAVGDRLPELTHKVVTAEGTVERSTADMFAGKTVALFAMPGAFTPTCHVSHLPGFLNNLEALKAKGVDAVVAVSVNDPFVMEAWAKSSGANGKIEMIADGNATFTKAIGMDADLSIAALGTRSRRYAALVKDGAVTVVNIEETPSSAERSSAEELLRAL